MDTYLVEDTKDIGYGEPLSRYCIVASKESDARYFVWTVQHAIYDGWSMPLILAEVERAYNGASLSSNMTKFNRFIEYSMKLDREQSDEFWSAHLAGTLSKPFYYWPQPAWPPSVRPSVEKAMSKTCAIANLPRSNITLTTIVHVAWAFLHARYTGCDDVILRVSRNGRDLPVPEIENIIGPTINQIPLRIHMN